jgi:hypothetical protein
LRSLGRHEEALSVIDEVITSSKDAYVLRQAYMQRGILKKYELPTLKSNLDINACNKSILSDFEAAARLGHPLAPPLLKSLNPYAAMCNAVMKDLFQKENLFFPVSSNKN